MCDLHFILCLLWSWLPMCGAGCPCRWMELVAPISQAQKCEMRMRQMVPTIVIPLGGSRLHA